MLIFVFQQNEARTSMQEQIREGSASFEHLRMTISELQQYKVKDDVISIDGKLYDIAEIKIFGDEVELLVVNDSFEERTIANVKALFNGKQNRNSDLPKMLLKLFAFEYLYPPDNSLMPPLITYEVSLAQSPKEYISISTDILCPPPNIG